MAGITTLGTGIAFLAPDGRAKAIVAAVAGVASLTAGYSYFLHTFRLGVVYKSLNYKYAPVVLWQYVYPSAKAFRVGM